MKQHKTLTLQGTTLTYTLNQSPKLKRLSMRRDRTGHLIVNQPLYYSDLQVKQFLTSKADRILKHYQRFQTKTLHPDLSNHTRDHFLKHKQAAYDLCASKVHQRSQIIPYKYNRITVKSLKTKRGSCSSKKNLNFNYKILRLPEHLQDYLIVHEMCHLREMNHSSRFWDLVEDYYGPRKSARTQLKSY